jgi:hypothetical protein
LHRDTRSSRRDLAAAWVSVGAVPAAIVAGRAASIAFLDARGYPPPLSEPPGLGLAAFGLLASIVLVPTISGIWFGLAAARAGRPSGTVAALLAGTIGGGLVALGLPLFLSRIVGWPAVILIGAALAGLVAVVAVGSGRQHRSRT